MPDPTHPATHAAALSTADTGETRSCTHVHPLPLLSWEGRAWYKQPGQGLYCWPCTQGCSCHPCSQLLPAHQPRASQVEALTPPGHYSHYISLNRHTRTLCNTYSEQEEEHDRANLIFLRHTLKLYLPAYCIWNKHTVKPANFQFLEYLY